MNSTKLMYKGKSFIQKIYIWFKHRKYKKMMDEHPNAYGFCGTTGGGKDDSFCVVYEGVAPIDLTGNEEVNKIFLDKSNNYDSIEYDK